MRIGRVNNLGASPRGIVRKTYFNFEARPTKAGRASLGAFNLDYRVKAFSLNEMVVVLMITAIVVGMAFSVLKLVQRQLGSIEGIYSAKLEVNRVRQALWLDFNRYSTITYDPRSESLNFNNEMESMNYIIEDDMLIRERDTFNIKLESKSFYFANNPIESGQIDALELTTNKETGRQHIFVYRNNTAANYLNQ